MFNPSHASAKVESLESLLQTAREKTREMFNHQQAVMLAINEKRDALAAMDRVATRAYNAALATGIHPTLLSDLKSIYAKLRGRNGKRESISADAVDPPVKTGRGPVPHFDATSRIRNFASFIKVLELHGDYQPKEGHISLHGMRALLEKLEEKQATLIAVNIQYKRAAQECKVAVFGANGIFGISKLLKRYMQSEFGANSHEFRSVVKIRFIGK